MRLMPSRDMILFQSVDSNWLPLSDVSVVGTPYLATHVDMNALATVVVSMSVIGVASGHLVKRSTQVRMYL